jgi:hypothetical protein
MVLQGRPCGRVERRQIYGPLGNEGAVFIGSVDEEAAVAGRPGVGRPAAAVELRAAQRQRPRRTVAG